MVSQSFRESLAGGLRKAADGLSSGTRTVTEEARIANRKLRPVVVIVALAFLLLVLAISFGQGEWGLLAGPLAVVGLSIFFVALPLVGLGAGLLYALFAREHFVLTTSLLLLALLWAAVTPDTDVVIKGIGLYSLVAIDILWLIPANVRAQRFTALFACIFILATLILFAGGRVCTGLWGPYPKKGECLYTLDLTHPVWWVVGGLLAFLVLRALTGASPAKQERKRERQKEAPATSAPPKPKQAPVPPVVQQVDYTQNKGSMNAVLVLGSLGFIGAAALSVLIGIQELRLSPASQPIEASWAFKNGRAAAGFSVVREINVQIPRRRVRVLSEGCGWKQEWHYLGRYSKEAPGLTTMIELLVDEEIGRPVQGKVRVSSGSLQADGAALACWSNQQLTPLRHLMSYQASNGRRYYRTNIPHTWE